MIKGWYQVHGNKYHSKVQALMAAGQARAKVAGQRIAHAPGLRTALVGQVALGGAILELEAGRVAEAGCRERVADVEYVAALLQRLPEVFIGVRRQEDERKGKQKPSHFRPRLQR